MIEVERLNREIRNLINKPRKQAILLNDKISWNKLCASLDTIDDVELAISHYNKLENFNGYNGGYLYFYGLLQALFLQQDSLNSLNVSLFGEEIDFKKDFPKLYEIRELRNDSIGHPTNRRNNKSFHVINGNLLFKYKVQVIDYFPGKEDNFREIDLKNIIKIQNDLAVEILGKIKKKLVEENKKHKMKFQGEKLIDKIPDNLHRYISKIRCGLNRAEGDFDFVFKIYKEIKKGVEERYSTVKALPDIEYSVEKLDFIFDRISRLFKNNNVYKNVEANVYIDSLKREFNELIDMVKEIDEDFKLE